MFLDSYRKSLNAVDSNFLATRQLINMTFLGLIILMNYYSCLYLLKLLIQRNVPQNWFSVFTFFSVDVICIMLYNIILLHFFHFLLLQQVYNSALTLATHPHLPSLNISDVFKQHFLTLCLFSQTLPSIPLLSRSITYNFTLSYNFFPIMDAHST